MPRRLLSIALALGLTATACGGGSETDVEAAVPAEATPTTDASTPEFLNRTVSLVDGSSVDLTDYAGDDLVLWFWAPW